MYSEAMKLFLDALQLRLHIAGYHGLAAFFGRFGTRASYPKLRALTFDPTFENNEGIDVDKDLNLGLNRLDVN